jgi:hypothetical protein
MTTTDRKQVDLDDNALLRKPIQKKRSLASSLSIDNFHIPSSSSSSSSLSSSPPLLKRRKLNKTCNSNWKLQDLPELPFLYLKEKTSVVVLNENPQLIASRIVDCATSLNVYGQYDGEKAKATLTLEEMQFSIQLFKVNDQNNNCVIVEIQRTNGSSIQFHKVARTLLKVAKDTVQKGIVNDDNATTNAITITTNNSDNNSDQKKNDNTTFVDKSIMKRSQSIYTSTTTSTSNTTEQKQQQQITKKQQHQKRSDENTNNNIIKISNSTNINANVNANTKQKEDIFTCTIEMVDALLKKDRVDANLLGMQSLQLLTSRQSTSDSMVKFVSNVVVSGNANNVHHHNNNNESHDIKDMITSLIAKYTIGESGHEESLHNVVEEGYYQKMRVCALSILANSLKNVFDDVDGIGSCSNAASSRNSVSVRNIDSVLSSDDWLGDHGLLILLLDELKNAKTNPKEAYLAGKSLELVLRKSMMMRSHASKLDVHGIVTESYKFGKSSYPLLESISDTILQSLIEV